MAFFVFTVSDVVRPASATQVWLLELYVIAVMIGAVYRSVAFPLTLLMLAFMGAEDLFFFIIKRQLPPPQLPNLYSHRLIILQPATPLSLIAGLLVALTLGACAVVAERWIKQSVMRAATKVRS